MPPEQIAQYLHQNKSVRVIPIIINHCNWELIRFFSEKNALPSKGEPAVRYIIRDEATHP